MCLLGFDKGEFSMPNFSLFALPLFLSFSLALLPSLSLCSPAATSQIVCSIRADVKLAAGTKMSNGARLSSLNSAGIKDKCDIETEQGPLVVHAPKHQIRCVGSECS